MLRGVTVREARLEDTDAIARVIAAVADEGLIATEPPVDLAARAQAFRRMIEAEGPEALWVLEEDGRVIGNAGVNETAAPGVLSLGMAILPEARGGAAVVLCWRRSSSTLAPLERTSSSLRCGPTTHPRSAYTPRLGSRRRVSVATTIAVATARSAPRSLWPSRLSALTASSAGGPEVGRTPANRPALLLSMNAGGDEDSRNSRFGRVATVPWFPGCPSIRISRFVGMASNYKIKNFEDIEPSGGDGVDGRFSRKFLDSAQLGVSRWRYEPGKQTGGHRHEIQEEVYTVISGSGRVKLDEEIIEIKQWDVIRVAPRVARGFEAGPDGLEIIAAGGSKPDGGEGSSSRATGQTSSCAARYGFRPLSATASAALCMESGASASESVAAVACRSDSGSHERKADGEQSPSEEDAHVLEQDCPRVSGLTPAAAMAQDRPRSTVRLVMPEDGLDALIAEQVSYYRARAAEYDSTVPIDDGSRATLLGRWMPSAREDRFSSSRAGRASGRPSLPGTRRTSRPLTPRPK